MPRPLHFFNARSPGDEAELGPTVVEGLIGGTIGAGTVAGWFLIIDASRGRPLWTPALLAATLLDGVRDAQTLHITARLVLTYTVVHWLAFLIFGLLAAAVLAAADREPRPLV